MKHFLLPLLALTLLAACGKENKSGKSSWSYTDPYLGNINTGSVPSHNGVSVSTILNEVGCYAGGSGNQRQQMQLPLTGFHTVIPSGDFYVGLTSYGDVGVIIGQGNSTPVFIAYLCPRPFTSYQGSVISNVRLGSYSQCKFKPLPSASLVFPNGTGSADFRMLDFGKYNGSSMTPLSICTPTSQW